MNEESFSDLKKSLNQAIDHAELSERDWELFMEAIRKEEPNDNLKKAVKRHNQILNDGEVD